MQATPDTSERGWQTSTRGGTRDAALRLTLWGVVCCFVMFGAALAQKKQPPARPLDINTATVEQLQQLPGIGPATARAIVRFREKSGAFRRIEDLLAVRGISKRKLEALRPYITLTPPQTLRTSPKSP